ncbi:MAG: DUF4367 domain-containing protein [Clostridia bacterium]|nr:DUF4367 domain-containing protein [Clostridia bacterium]
MNRQEELLRQACAMLAEEETNALENSLSPAAKAEAEKLYRQHRLKIFALIQKETKKKKGAFPFLLKAAACLMLIAGAAWIGLHQHHPDPIPMTPLPSASIVPYYSPVPTETIIPTHAPEETAIPTLTPDPTSTPTPVPTITPTFTLTPTPSPTFTPLPTRTPDVAEAAPAVIPEETSGTAPGQWQGVYFPQALPEGYAIADTEEDSSSRSIVYTKDTSSIIFTEYNLQKAMTIQEGAKLSYVQIGDQIGLKMETDNAVTLSWEMDGHTLSITCTAADAEEIAASVKKVSR